MCDVQVAGEVGEEPEVAHGADLALSHQVLPGLEGVPEGTGPTATATAATDLAPAVGKTL
jgi:hypothetical protein